MFFRSGSELLNANAIHTASPKEMSPSPALFRFGACHAARYGTTASFLSLRIRTRNVCFAPKEFDRKKQLKGGFRSTIAAFSSHADANRPDTKSGKETESGGDDGGDDYVVIFEEDSMRYPETNYEYLTKARLKELCRYHKLKVTGTKNILIDRLKAMNIERENPQSSNDDKETLNDDSHKQIPQDHAIVNTDSEQTISEDRMTSTQAEEDEAGCGLADPRYSVYQFCFDKAHNYQLINVQDLKDQGRESDALLSPRLFAVDESLELFEMLPEPLRRDSFLNDAKERTRLIEIVLDLERRPLAWMKGQKRRFLNEDESVVVTQEQLNDLLSHVYIGKDNRAGINGQLHRISVMRNRSGSAKTSIVRDAARLLSENENVVIVDTSNEIGGFGDVPHACIGMARRMHVGSLDEQAKVMVEAVQNHTPTTMIIDEIGRRSEVRAAQTCKERGVRIVASAHGNLPGLVRNVELCDLVGGFSTVTLGDEMARRMKRFSKTRTERRGPPIFDVIVELDRGFFNEWHVVPDVGKAVDSILEKSSYEAQVRKRNETSESPIYVETFRFHADSATEQTEFDSIQAEVVVKKIQ